METKALLFADIVDSTQTVQRLGDVAAAAIWEEHDRRARALLASCNGREIDRSDGFLLLFDDAVSAARFALRYHEALEDLPFKARTGLHVGPVSLRENAPAHVALGAKALEVEGLAKPLAARVMALAEGGRLLMTASARHAIDGDSLSDAVVRRHGHYRLKGIDEPVELFELHDAGRAAGAPPRDGPKAFAVFRTDDGWQPVRAITNNLLAERDAFVGRAAELRSLASRLEAGSRCLTVLGVGGTGKTRFVHRYARMWLGEWPGGVYFCDLSEARSLEGICFVVAGALGLTLGRDDPVLQLGRAIAGRDRCLVVLDNFEQVVQHAQASLGHWLDRPGEAAFVVTSRERLRLRGEEVFPLDPLSVASEAIELFGIRARSRRTDFELDDGHRDAVAQVVRLLDGLPLAIELAAARIAVLSPTQLVARLSERLRVLVGASGASKRQATLRAALDWSWDLLAPWEQGAFAQCSTFEGGFTLEAAEAILDLSAWPDAPSVLEAVEALVDKSLLYRAPSASRRLDIDEPLFGMYLSIHEYAAEQLAVEPASKRDAESRHGVYFARFGSDAAIESLSRHGGVKRWRALELELDNLVASCRRGLARDDYRIAADAYRAAWEVISQRGPFVLGINLGDEILSRHRLSPIDFVDVQTTRGTAAWRAGKLTDAETSFEQALAIAKESRDGRAEGVVLGLIGSMHSEHGQRLDEARQQLEASVALHRAQGSWLGESKMLGNLGNLHMTVGRMSEARDCYEAALVIHRRSGNRLDEGNVLGNLGVLEERQGLLRSACRLMEEALVIHREIGARRMEGGVLGNLGTVLEELGSFESAGECLDQALSIHREVGNRNFEGIVLLNLGSLHMHQGRLDDARDAFEHALVALREVGNKRGEGLVLARCAQHSLKFGQLAQAREALVTGETLLRQVGDRHELGRLFCTRGHLELESGDVGGATGALDESRGLASEIAAPPESSLRLEIAALEIAIASKEASPS